MEHGNLPAANRGRNRPIRIALTYAVFGLLWVVISSWVLGLLPEHSMQLNRLVFVFVNAVILYVVAARYAARIQLLLEAEREIAARSRGYFESSVEGIVAVDQHGVIHQLNPRALEMFGYDETDLVGHPVEVLLPTRLRERHAIHRGLYFANPQSRRMGQGMEVMGRRKDGSEFPAEISLNFVRTHRGNLVVAFVSDVTERRAMEREARRSETLNALGAVAAGIAHELNNPLAVISSRIELMLAEDGKLPEALRGDLSVLQRNVERASRISGNLLSLARQRPASRQPVNLNESIAEAVTIVKGDSLDRMQIDLSLGHGLPLVMGDPTAIEQVLINLVMNAREADAHAVRIETGCDSGRPGFVQLTITDDGAGIDPEAHQRLFEPFFTTKPKGTGLGLWLSRRIVLEHGGSIEAMLGDERGTRFVIALPMITQGAMPPHGSGA